MVHAFEALAVLIVYCIAIYYAGKFCGFNRLD